MKVIWSDEANEDLKENIRYLQAHWSDKSAIGLVEQIEAALSLIQTNPKLYPETSIAGIRKAVIRKQISLFYTVVESELYVVRIWNNYKRPESFKLK